MTKEQREESLINARKGAQWLQLYVLGQIAASLDEQLKCLIEEFYRLDVGEQTRNAAGRQHGHLGAEYGNKPAGLGKKRGRPRKEEK